jgi:hypothetical protein
MSSFINIVPSPGQFTTLGTNDKVLPLSSDDHAYLRLPSSLFTLYVLGLANCIWVMYNRMSDTLLPNYLSCLCAHY